MRGKALAAKAVGALLGTLLGTAEAGESRAALTVGAQVMLSGTVNMTAGAPQPRTTQKSNERQQAGACSPVSLACAGPGSTRVSVNLSEGMMLTGTEEAQSLLKAIADGDSGINNLCAPAGPANVSERSALSVCTRGENPESQILGVSVDY